MNILVSKCLLGENCRYCGDNCKNDKVLALGKRYTLVGICPEQDGGLPTPRLPAERVGERVLAKDGSDVTRHYNEGAHLALAAAKQYEIAFAVLKAKSPSCGKGVIYDGSFTGAKTKGNGVTAQLLLDNGYTVYTEDDLEDNFEYKK